MSNKSDPARLKYLKQVALDITARLPEDREDAHEVIDLVTDLVDNYVNAAPSPPHLVAKN